MTLAAKKKQKSKNNDRKVRKKNRVYISVLKNSALYFIDSVLLIAVKGKYQLVVIHDATVLWNKVYTTIRGARIAYQKVFKKKSFQERIKADWSYFYPPEPDWLNERLLLLQGRWSAS
ncbi:MAG: hypothetical protein GTO45_39320 [Candidatus Aminicenantes bacterium]|nr:hypothetical protein [Candidatus Aminicenantes bacterium]NIM84680.1 hypothetical protein [Candidatus Aminicenantes bacterium]NIN24179.1 hypothetical protein [Candidatus Aminicenantes bacterium]NIN47904.1 hypothetical protein [Candidatus Aminicenantes bacterium]NIN90842.1 hypothetical protein [Candidatus Aminicenantes bacterium]